MVLAWNECFRTRIQFPLSSWQVQISIDLTQPLLEHRMTVLILAHHLFSPPGPGYLGSLHLRGHQHPSEHAVYTEHPLSTLQANIRTIWAVLDRELLPSRLLVIHDSLASREPPLFDVAGGERVSQDIMHEVLAQGVWITRGRGLRGQECVEAWPSIRPLYGGTVVRGVRASSRRHNGCSHKVLAKRK